MNVDYENITQIPRWFDSHLFAPYYRKLGNIRNPAWLRLGAPLIGIVDGLMSAALSLAGLCEAIFKGLANALWGAANLDSRLLKKGLLQIVLGGGSIALLSIPIIALRTLRTMAKMAYDPQSAISEERRRLPPCRTAPIIILKTRTPKRAAAI